MSDIQGLVLTIIGTRITDMMEKIEPEMEVNIANSQEDARFAPVHISSQIPTV